MSNEGCGRLRDAAAALLIVLGVTLIAAPTHAIPEASPTRQCATQTPTGLVREAHPVVLVHGWSGDPGDMQPLRTLLEADPEVGTGWQYILFDYSSAATQWASSPDVAYCLGDFLLAVSAAHKAAGGDGIVYVVAHSMGGLAARYATAATLTLGNGNTIGPPNVSDILGGLVTLDTPHTGSPWGDTPYASLKELGSGLTAGLPVGTSRARVCLATQRPGPSLVDGCGPVAPYLPTSVPIHQIAGQVTLERRLFGLFAYEIPLAGDSIVWTDSQHGYLGSASGSTRGQRVSSETVTCRGTDGEVIGTSTRLLTRWAGPVAGEIAQLKADELALNAIESGNSSPMLALMLTVNLTVPCSHAMITHNAGAAASTAKALQGFADRADQARAAPTEVVVIDSPFALDGSISAEYSVEDQASYPPVDCAYDSGSPSALTGGTHWCGTTADNAHSCWESPTTPGLLACINEPWNSRLRLLRAIGVGETGPPELPEPLGIELADGTRWWIRHGGSWGGRADGLVGAYGCASESDCRYPGLGPYIAVLAGDWPAVDRTTEPWTVLIGDLDDPNIDYPDPIRIPVRRAWFIADS